MKAVITGLLLHTTASWSLASEHQHWLLRVECLSDGAELALIYQGPVATTAVRNHVRGGQ